MKRILSLFVAFIFCCSLWAQESPTEEDFYKIVTPPVPEGILLEVGGLAVLPDGRLAVATRRGDVWIIENPTGAKPYFRKFASGLHEILGLVYQNGSLICAQRGELTKLTDRDHDGKADSYETIAAWPLSAHYHEYSYGPKIAPDGSYFVSGNVAFGDEEWWAGESRRPLRGWIYKVKPDGQIEPWATGVRSPCGLGIFEGELFYDDNQGDWIGSGGIWHVKKGAFMGHPAGLRWTKEMANSPVKLTQEQIYASTDPRKVRDKDGRAIKPENIQNEKAMTLADLKKKYPDTQLPAVWLPHGILGISNAEIIVDETGGKFGPFAGQLFVGDQGQSKVMRVFLEKVKGEYQGAAFDFRSGFQSGVLRMAWANDGGSMYIGETNRGWGSAGDANQGLQRLVWTGKTPFEMKAVRAMPDGFEVEFTMPVDQKSAQNLASYAIRSFTYKYHPVYGSPTINEAKCAVKGVKVSEDGLKARIVVDNLREAYVHEIKLEGVRSAGRYWSLVHPTAYYTLNQLPDGEKLKLADISTKSTPTATTKTPEAKPTTTKATASNAKVPTNEEIQPLLAKHTCLACHAVGKRQVGPAYTEVAKRKYSNEKIVDLIYNPQPQNWPDYATPMAPMPQVPRADALKIAAWINSLAPKSAPKP
ncbi:MAG: c-type cytochrome [Runella sp.]